MATQQQQQAGEGEELPGTQHGSLGDVLSVEFVVSDTPPSGPDDTPQLRFEVCMALLRCGAFLGGTAGTVWAVLGTEGAIVASRAAGRPGFGYADVEQELEARDYRVWLLPAVLPGTVPVRAAMPYVLREPPKHVQPVVEQSCFDPAAPLRARQAVIHGLREIEPRGLPVVAPGQLGELACALAAGRLVPLLHVNGRVVSLDEFHTAAAANGLPASRKDAYGPPAGEAKNAPAPQRQ